VDSGLNGINISLDSLDRNTFKSVTGHDRLPEILKGINFLPDLNFENIKINAVLLNGINASDKDFESWGEFIKKNKVDFRYIELMQTGATLDYFKKYPVSSKIFQERFHKNNWIFLTSP
jgi:Molybdenum cofactor biosynthesis enzyme